MMMNGATYNGNRENGMGGGMHSMKDRREGGKMAMSRRTPSPTSAKYAASNTTRETRPRSVYNRESGTADPSRGSQSRYGFMKDSDHEQARRPYKDDSDRRSQATRPMKMASGNMGGGRYKDSGMAPAAAAAGSPHRKMRGGNYQRGKLHSDREVGNGKVSPKRATSSHENHRKVVEVKEPTSSSSQATTSSEMQHRKKPQDGMRSKRGDPRSYRPKHIKSAEETSTTAPKP